MGVMNGMFQIAKQASDAQNGPQKAMEAENTLQIELSFRKEKNGNLTVILNFPGLSIFGNCCLEFTLDKVDQDSMSTLKQQVFFLAGQLNTSKSREMKNFGEIETLNDKIKNIEDNLKESREMELKHKAEVDQMKQREESLYAQIEEMKLREGRLNEEVTQVRGHEVNLRNKVNRREVQAEEMVDRSQGIMTETQGNYDVDIGSEGVESISPEQEVRKNRERQADLSDEQDTKKRLAEKQKKIWAVVEKKQKALKEARSNFDRGMAHWNKKSSRRYRSLPANHPDYVTDWDGIQKWQDKAIQLEKEIVSLRREYRDVQAQ